MKLLHRYIDPGETLLHVVASYDDPGLMEIVLESVSEEQHYDLLGEGDNYMQTPIHYACARDNSDLLKLVKKHTSQDTWYKLLQIQDWEESTALHEAVESWFSAPDSDTINLIANSLSARQLINLFKLKDETGITPLQATNYAPFLQEYQTCALTKLDDDAGNYLNDVSKHRIFTIFAVVY